MSMIHEALYSSENLSTVDLSAYLENLVSHLQGATRQKYESPWNWIRSNWT